MASGLCAKIEDLRSSGASPGDEKEAGCRLSAPLKVRESKKCIVQVKGWRREETQETRKRTLKI